MTLIAGIVSRRPGVPVPATACESLRRSISRDPRDEARVFADERSYFVKVDIANYGEPADIAGEDGTLTLVTGEPLLILDGESKPSGRKRDAALIHDAFLNNDPGILRSANGAFAAIHYKPSTGSLTLIADKLAIRPLYYWIDDDIVVVASSLRVLEELSEIPKKMDVRTVTEIVGLGYPLADRTPYAGIRLLRPAEIVRVTGNETDRRTYWRWDAIAPSDAPEEELLAELYERFGTAVSRRIGSDTATTAYLSGGLDSRCIVAALRSQSVQVHTYNFARPKTQDQVFGLEFAREMDTIHEEMPKAAGDLVPAYSVIMSDGLKRSQTQVTCPPERPGTVWSGEGGSVALGHVHLTEGMIEQMRKGDINGVITEHIKRESAVVSPRLFRKELSAEMSTVLEDGIRSEVGRVNADDPARNFYLYLLLNDQHRKLAGHFEHLDLHRLEFALPFFDSEFLAALLTVPIDLCLRHRFYVKWLALFPPAVASIPWQVYPGHTPCPVPVSHDLAYQWASEYQTQERAIQKRTVMQRARDVLRASDFPAAILDKKILRLAAMAHSTGLRNYEYLIGPASTFYTYWHKCGGNYVLPNGQ